MALAARIARDIKEVVMGGQKASILGVSWSEPVPCLLLPANDHGVKRTD